MYFYQYFLGRLSFTSGIVCLDHVYRVDNSMLSTMCLNVTNVSTVMLEIL